MDIRKAKKKASRVFVILLSLGGFIAQVTWMSVLYFSYATTTQVKLTLEETIRQHSLALCVRYSDILDRERLFKDSGVEMVHVTDIEEAKNEELKLTVKQIFDYTPKSSDVVAGCFYRPDNLVYKTGVQSECAPLFNVSRYFTQEFMCYRMKPLIHMELRTESVTLSRFKQFTIYDLLMTSSFKKATLVMPITFVDEFPYLSRRFTEVVIMKKEVDGDERDYNWFHISPSDFRIYRLEAPYDTMCTNRPTSDIHICRRTCLMKKFKEWNRVPTSEIIVEPVDLKPLSYAELSNETFKEEVNRTYNSCNKDCSFQECEVSYTKTRFRALLFKDFPLALTSMTPTEADIVTQAQAQMTFVEYFSFICGCFGTWFGISFFSLTRVRKLVRARVLPLARSHRKPQRLGCKPPVTTWTYLRR